MCNDINNLTNEEHELLVELISNLKQDFVRNYISGFEEIVSPERSSNYNLREVTLRNEDEELYNIYMRTLFHEN